MIRSRICRWAFLLALASCTASFAQIASGYDAVDPMIGTSSGGNTFPGASLPFGMVQWSPDTNGTGFYVHEEKSIYGLSLTHLSGAGCPLGADFPVLPWAGGLEASPANNRATYALSFDHSREQAHPGYYSLTLANGTQIELTVTDRSGIARFHFPQGTPARLLVNTGGSANADVHMAFLPPVGREHDSNSIEVVGNSEVMGAVTSGGFCGSATRYSAYMAAEFDRPFTRFTTWQDEKLQANGRKAEGKDSGAWLDFGDTRQVLMKVSLSYVSEAGALANLKAELPGWNFDQVHASARERWTKLLNHVSVEGGSAEQRTIFYTGLYHSLLAPTLFSDANGDYTGFDWKVRSLAGAKQRAQYANFSDWDTYRNTIQLQALLAPEQTSDMMQSLVNDAVQSGWLPRWPAANQATYVMGGDSPPVLLSSAHAFGARNFDTSTALRYMLKGASQPGDGPHTLLRYNQTEERPFLAEYLKFGYVPSEDAISASRTLEYATDDFAIAQFARSVGDESNYRRLLKQSGNWKNLFDPETRWIRPRNAEGRWLPGFDPIRSLPRQEVTSVPTDQSGFEEGNTFQYTFMIPFDYPALIAGIGGDDPTATRLDKFFSKLVCWGEPCFNMANEPDFVTPYAYVFAGMPWKTQEVVTRIARETFKAAPDGIPGNDDLGATSGVYVWNALGMYPAVPGVGGVVLGTPMFDKAAIHFDDGRALVIHKQGPGFYVQSVLLNGKPYTSSWLPLSLLSGTTTELEFKMATTPNKERGRSSSARPPVFR